jgi:hypothetical protein
MTAVNYFVGHNIAYGDSNIDLFNHIAAAAKRPSALSVSYGGVSSPHSADLSISHKYARMKLVGQTH